MLPWKCMLGTRYVAFIASIRETNAPVSKRKMNGQKEQGPNRSRTGDFGKVAFESTAVLHSTTELPALRRTCS